MQKLKRLLVILAGWIIITSLYAWYYVITILNLPEEYDAYARNWQFQLLMFVLFRLPYMLLLLLIVAGGALVWPVKKQASEA